MSAVEPQDYAARLANLEFRAVAVDQTVGEIRDHFSDFMTEMHELSSMLQRLLTQFDEREKRIVELTQDHRQAFERFDNRINDINTKAQDMAVQKAVSDSRLRQLENFQKALGAVSIGLLIELGKRWLSGGTGQ